MRDLLAVKIKTNATAFILGFRDGWCQPHYLNWSTNVEHLSGYDAQTQEWLDRGINLGQRVRAARSYQRLDALLKSSTVASTGSRGTDA